MHYDFLDFSDIILIFSLGFIIGIPCGWFIISKATAIYAWLHHKLRIKRNFKPLGVLSAAAAEK